MGWLFYEELFFMLAFAGYIVASIAFFVLLVSSKEKVGKFAVAATSVGFALHTVAMFVRIIESGRLPFSNQYEFANSFTWGIVLCYLAIHFYYRFTAVGAFVMPLAFLMMGYASLLPRHVRPLMPALQSRWLTIHVGTAVVSYGAFAVACGLSVLYLLNSKKSQDNQKKKLLPDQEAVDFLSYRVAAFGYLMLTIVIVSGAIWARSAWSRYWAWDPKEVWSLITWLIYSVYLHLRFNRGWKGKPAAWFSIIGFACVIFTFIGVNMFLPSIHSYV